MRSAVRSIIDMGEAVMLKDRIGEIFGAVVTDLDDRGARIQLSDLPVVARVDAHGVEPGDTIRVKLTVADPDHRSITFARVN